MATEPNIISPSMTTSDEHLEAWVEERRSPRRQEKNSGTQIVGLDAINGNKMLFVTKLSFLA